MKVYEIVEATQGILVSGNKDDEINGLFIKVGRIQFIILSYIFLFSS